MHTTQAKGSTKSKFTLSVMMRMKKNLMMIHFMVREDKGKGKKRMNCVKIKRAKAIQTHWVKRRKKILKP